MEAYCPICDFVLERLGVLHQRRPEESGFSAYTLLHEGLDGDVPEAIRSLSQREIEVHIARHLKGSVHVFADCCTARRYRLASMGPPPEVCSL
jgi:hypothetical protein